MKELNNYRYRVAVCGHFGGNRKFFDGQTIKTKNIADCLEKEFGSKFIARIDTFGGMKRILIYLCQLLGCLKKSDNVIILPAQNGVRILAPFLAFFNRFFHKKLHYVVIGGWLPQFLTKHKSLSSILKKFDGIYVETNTMKSALEAQGFENIYVMPNCKKLTVLSENELVYPLGVPYKLCTFSRVMREKGIEDAVKAVVAANKALGAQAFSLDIYGQVDGAQTEWFDSLQKEFPSYIRYGGLVPFDKSVDALKDYFALLFPTYYEGEGFAGTLIDAYSAGVPVIASDWKYNSEIVNENVGFVYPTGNQLAFVDILKAIAIDPTLLLRKKRLCLTEANKYNIDKVVQVLIEQLEND